MNAGSRTTTPAVVAVPHSLWLKCICFGILASAALFGVLIALPVWRFGDGGEYYALYLAALNHGKPFMTAGAWLDYSTLIDQGSVASMPSTEALRSAFPTLVSGETADFNHFWLYSGLAAAASATAQLFGLDLAPHSAFMLLHSILFGATIGLAIGANGTRGAFVVALLFLASPVLWFAAKVHTEFFTVGLVLQSFILVSRNRFFYAALPIAIASTQNISLAATAWLLIGIGSLNCHLFRTTPRRSEILSAAFALGFTMLHPLYYLFRQGVLTPQLKAGGASVGTNSEQILAVLIDPDIGLLPNWPLGVLLVIACTLVQAKLRARPNIAHVTIAAFYLVTNLFAQASTTNLNSGSVDLSRYALWYVPLLYAPVVWFVGVLTKQHSLPLVLITTLVAPLLAWNMSWYWPARYERYTEPSHVSGLLQSTFPRLYDPPIEVFIERNSGLGEGGVPAGAVAGPKCRKLFIPAEMFGAGRIEVISRHACDFDPESLASIVSRAVDRQQGVVEGMFIALSSDDVRSLQRRHSEGRVSFAAGANGVSALQSGWSPPEHWGTWSNATESHIRMQVRDCTSDSLKVTLSARGFATEQNPRVRATVLLNAQAVGVIEFTADDAGPRPFTFNLSCAEVRRNDNALDLKLSISGAASPALLGLGPDSRLLGIGIESLDFSHVPPSSALEITAP